jgi:putative methyltransferase (TIGR04325 family)
MQRSTLTTMPFQRVHRLVDQMGMLPGVFHLRKALFARRFRGRLGHAFHGIFDTFEAAETSVSSDLPPSYDNPAAARMYENRLEVDDHDYPAMFWLQDALAGGLRRVADLGGSTGIKFYAFGSLIDLPADVLWRVIETGAAARLGRAIATQKSMGSQLEFSSEVQDADGFDVLLAS